MVIPLPAGFSRKSEWTICSFKPSESRPCPRSCCSRSPGQHFIKSHFLSKRSSHVDLFFVMEMSPLGSPSLEPSGHPTSVHAAVWPKTPHHQSAWFTSSSGRQPPATSPQREIAQATHSASIPLLVSRKSDATMPTHRWYRWWLFLAAIFILSCWTSIPMPPTSFSMNSGSTLITSKDWSCLV